MSKQVTKSIRTADSKEAIKFLNDFKWWGPSKETVFEIRIWTEVPDKEMTPELEEEVKFRELLFEGKDIPDNIKCGAE